MTNATKPINVVILGGGMAALAAAYKLAFHPDAKSLFDITVYQVGWRLGGKCASARNAGAQLRVEEHGLHVWFGCYANAFSMLRDCYRQLGRESEMELMFTGQTDTPYMEDHEGWKVWPVHFDRKSGSMPNGDARGSDAYLFTIHALDFSVRRSRELLPSVTPLGTVDGSGLETILGELQQFLNSHPQDLPPDGGQWQAVVEKLERARALLLSLFPDPTAIADEIRRKLIEANLAATVVIGAAKEGLIFHKDYDRLDGKDFREWLRFYGAWQSTLDSAPVRALYDLCFAYLDGVTDWAHANFAAGAALNTVSRIALDYFDYVVYEMRAGMGDMVIAPIYQALRAKDVKFKFFHRIKRLELSSDRASVAAIHFERQVQLRQEPYEPLFQVPSPTPPGGKMWAWPSEPDYSQILDNVKGYDLESRWSGWKGTDDHIAAGKHYDAIILAISIEEARELCSELRVLPRWTDLDHIKTVETFSLQLWMNKTLKQLGWPHGSVPVDAAPEPLDVWADRTEIVKCEDWKYPSPDSLQYLCGPLSGNYASMPTTDPSVPWKAKMEALKRVVEWLNEYACVIWKNAGMRHAFDWSLLFDLSSTTGPDRLSNQYLRANINHSDRYVLSVAGSTKYRLATDASGASNLLLAGDWTHSQWNAGCVETAVSTGFNAANELARRHGITLAVKGAYSVRNPE